MDFDQNYYRKASDKQIGYITFLINRDYYKELGDLVRGANGTFLRNLTGQESGDLIKCLMAQDTACFKSKFRSLKKGKEENKMDDEDKKNNEESIGEPNNSGEEPDEEKSKE